VPTNFQLFGTAHLAILSAVVVLAAVFAAIQRRLTPATRWLRVALGSLLLLDSLVYYGYLAWRGQLTFPDHLPLELCDASLFLTIFTLFTLNRAVYDLAYYWALAGATMALLTPNLWEPFPSFGTIQFFVDHGLIVTSVLFLAWSGLMRPRAWSVARAMLVLNILAVFIGAFDYFFKTDYMYLRAKPQNASLLDLLGPWPWYIAATEVVALLLFVLLYLPFRRRSIQEAAGLFRRDGAPASEVELRLTGKS
jgi:hypothetical integral membrane protein (TIGR02206 family)